MKQKRWSHFIKQKKSQRSRRHPLNFFVPLVEQVQSGIVSIVTEDAPSIPDVHPFIRDFLGTTSVDSSSSSIGSDRSFGSGFIFHPNGYILTSEHVIGKSNAIYVKLFNGKVFKAQRVFCDYKRDYAIIKIDANCKLHPLPLGNSEETSVGEWVMSVGSPLGLENSVTTRYIR